MHIDLFNPRSLILFFCLLQGTIFSVLLFLRASRNKNSSDFWLASLLILLSLSTVSDFIGFAGVYDVFKQIKDLTFFPFSNPFGYGVLIYLYVQTVSNSKRKFERRDWLLFIPSIIFYVYQFLAFAQEISFKNWYENAIHIPFISPFFAVTAIMFNGYLLFYSIKYYRQYRTWLNENFSDTETIKFNWLRNFLYLFTAILLITALFSLTTNFIFKLSYKQFFWLSLINAFSVYYLAIAGYLRSNSIELNFAEIKTEEIEGKKSLLSEKELETLKAKIKNLMINDKIFLEPSLTLNDVARTVGVNSTVLSYAINIGFEKNFNDFVNQFRIDAVKTKLTNTVDKNLLGVAFDCGFNSKATFNRSFKKFTGVSPKEFQESLKLSNEVAI